jgi:hypothetical protein
MDARLAWSLPRASIQPTSAVGTRPTTGLMAAERDAASAEHVLQGCGVAVKTELVGDDQLSALE